MDASNANLFAYLTLVLWAPVVLVLLAHVRPPLAVAIAYLAAILFLPVRVQFDLPAIPPLTKNSITDIAVLVGGLVWFRAALLRARPGRGVDLLIVVMLVAAFGTALVNPSPLHYGPTTLRGLSLYDGVSMALKDFLNIGVPFFIGRALYRDRDSINTLLLCLMVFALIYSAFILVELRLSPQWHKWIYGFHQHRFGQTFRLGGWRPMVFMAHGLAVAKFILVAALAAAALGRLKKRWLGVGTGAWAAALFVVLLLCKSTAAIVYGLFAVPIVAWFKPRTQLRFATALALLVVLYPLMRAYDVFPTATLTSMAQKLSAERAQSLAFRFHHEDGLLGIAREQLAWGWGGYRRNRVFDEAGRDRSVIDGYWIGLLGVRGLVATAATFALFLVPLWLARRRLASAAPDARRQIGVLSVIVAVTAVDFIPNGLFSVLPFFLAGSLAGAIAGLTAEEPTEEAEPSPQPVLARAPESFY